MCNFLRTEQPSRSLHDENMRREVNRHHDRRYAPVSRDGSGADFRAIRRDVFFAFLFHLLWELETLTACSNPEHAGTEHYCTFQKVDDCFLMLLDGRSCFTEVLTPRTTDATTGTVE